MARRGAGAARRDASSIVPGTCTPATSWSTSTPRRRRNRLGGLCRADPAIDLPLLWSGLPPDARGELLSAYGPVGEEPLLRARVLALFLGAALALYAPTSG